MTSGAAASSGAARTGPVLELTAATANRGGRTVWAELDLTVQPGELVAVLGPNGAGKSTLLAAITGRLQLAAGQVRVLGAPPSRGSRHVGWVPQHRPFDPSLPLRGTDLVGLGVDGHRFGLPLSRSVRARRRALVQDALTAVGAEGFADRRVGQLSGGEQQRIRIAAAAVGRPELVLADEPLLGLDLRRQREVVAVLDGLRRTNGAAVVMVTHDVNPVLGVADRLLFLSDGRWLAGPPQQVLTSEKLSALYGSPVQVLTVGGRVLVIGGADAQLAGSLLDCEHPHGVEDDHHHPDADDYERAHGGRARPPR